MITFYLARADNGVIGLDDIIPWHIPGEQRRFKAMTMGKPMVMGRKTFESFPSPLPRLEILRKPPAIDAYEYEDFALHGYEAQPHIKAAVAV